MDLQASYGYVWRNFQQAVSLIQGGAVDAAAIVDRSVSVFEPERAFEAFLERRTCKPVFEFGAQTR